MGDDGVTLNLSGIGVLPPSPDKPKKFPGGVALRPGGSLEYDPLLLGVEFRGGYHNDVPSGLGVSVFDIDAVWDINYYAGLRFFDDFTVKFGRWHFEESDVQKMVTERAYSVPNNFSYLTVPMGWLGAELRYDYLRDEGTVRQGLISVNYMRGGDDANLGLAHGMLSFALTASETPPILSVGALASIRSDSMPDAVDSKYTGFSHSEGGLFAFGYDYFKLGAAFCLTGGSFHEDSTHYAVEGRRTASIFMSLNPNIFVFRGAVSFLNQTVSADAALNPSVGQEETHLELAMGVAPVDSFMFSLGYRATFEADTSDHYLFVGAQTSLSHFFPFSAVD